MTEVAERRTGSEISAFMIDFLRMAPDMARGIWEDCPAGGAGILLLKEVATGVLAAESGGVFAAAKGGTGDACERNVLTFGLDAPGDGRGDAGSPGENGGFGLLVAGDSRGEAPFIEP